MNMGFGEVIGYYVAPNMLGPFCPHCYEELGYADQDTGEERDVPIFACGHEADTPSHCAQCEALIPHDLTPDGLEYVREAVEGLTVGQGSADIVRQWQEFYLGGRE